MATTHENLLYALPLLLSVLPMERREPYFLRGLTGSTRYAMLKALAALEQQGLVRREKMMGVRYAVYNRVPR